MILYAHSEGVATSRWLLKVDVSIDLSEYLIMAKKEDLFSKKRKLNVQYVHASKQSNYRHCWNKIVVTEM